MKRRRRKKDKGFQRIDGIEYRNYLAMYGDTVMTNPIILDVERPKCECGKIMYDSEKSANAAKNRIKFERGFRNKIYHCDLCGKFHLASIIN